MFTGSGCRLGAAAGSQESPVVEPHERQEPQEGREPQEPQVLEEPEVPQGPETQGEEDRQLQATSSEEYLTHINRRKASATTVSSSSKGSSTTKVRSQATWMSAFEMAHLRDFARSSWKLPKHYGPMATLLDAVHRGAAKAEKEIAGEIDDEGEQGEEESEEGEEDVSAMGRAWKSSGKLTKRADPLTGSWEEDVVEQKVSRDFDLSETVETKEVMVCTSGEGDMGDLENMNAMKEAEAQALLNDDDKPLVDLEASSPKLESLKYVAELFGDCGTSIAEQARAPTPRELVKRNTNARPAQTAEDGDNIVDIFNDGWMDWIVMKKRVRLKGWDEARRVSRQTATAAARRTRAVRKRPAARE